MTIGSLEISTVTRLYMLVSNVLSINAKSAEKLSSGNIIMHLNETESSEVYVILSATKPEIVDFTYYTDITTVLTRISELNRLTKSREYWYITLYRNVRNLGEGVKLWEC